MCISQYKSINNTAERGAGDERERAKELYVSLVMGKGAHQLSHKLGGSFR